jgi:hypothetical protein
MSRAIRSMGTPAPAAVASAAVGCPNDYFLQIDSEPAVFATVAWPPNPAGHSNMPANCLTRLGLPYQFYVGPTAQ